VPNSSTEQPPGLRERKKARTRAALRDHAMRLFREQGYAATTVDQIAEAAEVSQSTFFRYYPSKEAVVLTDDVDPLMVAAVRAQPPELGPLAAIRAGMRSVFDAMTPEEWARERDRAELIATVPELRAVAIQQYEVAIGLLSEVLAERAGRSTGDFAVRALAGAIIGVAIAASNEPGPRLSKGFLALLDEGLAHLESGWFIGSGADPSDR